MYFRLTFKSKVASVRKRTVEDLVDVALTSITVKNCVKVAFFLHKWIIDSLVSDLEISRVQFKIL